MSTSHQKPYSMFSKEDADIETKKTSSVPDVAKKKTVPAKSHSQDADRHSKIPHETSRR